jgi:hypothetical protein
VGCEETIVVEGCNGRCDMCRDSLVWDSVTTDASVGDLAVFRGVREK